MKTSWILIAGLMITSASNATQFKIVGTSPEPIYTSEVSLQPGGTLSALTLHQLNSAKAQNKIQSFIGDPTSITAIRTEEQGNLELSFIKISETELRAFGWCYSVDGVNSDLLPDEFHLTGTEKEIMWYYAYATRIGRKWSDQVCMPVSSIKR